MSASKVLKILVLWSRTLLVASDESLVTIFNGKVSKIVQMLSEFHMVKYCNNGHQVLGTMDYDLAGKSK
jgi:hypothetical protein